MHSLVSSFALNSDGNAIAATPRKIDQVLEPCDRGMIACDASGSPENGRPLMIERESPLNALVGES
jgi:hypothetical protein